MKEREGLRIIILRAILPLNSILLRGAVEEGPEVKRTVGDFVSLYFLKVYFFLQKELKASVIRKHVSLIILIQNDQK